LSVPSGSYYFGYIVGPSNAIAESDEANNAVVMAYPTQVPNYVPPTTCFTRNPVTGRQGTMFAFNATCSSDPDGSIATYTWDTAATVTSTAGARLSKSGRGAKVSRMTRGGGVPSRVH
jgi:hypothetical protein